MKPKNNISMFEALKALSSEQRAAATNPNHPINDRLRESLNEEDGRLKMIKKRSELQAMSNEELESYEQSLLALWTQELRLKIKLIDLVQSTKGN